MANHKKNTAQKIEESFQFLKDHAGSTLTVEEVLRILAGRGYPILLILFSIPFCQPIQIPGLSTPFGILICYIGLRVAFGHRVLLPQFLLKKAVPKKIILQISSKGLWLTHKITNITKPRWEFLSQKPFFHKLNGLIIALMGFILALPIPLPLSNLSVAWGTLIISMGLLEDDGLFIAIGYTIAILSILILAAIIYLIF